MLCCIFNDVCLSFYLTFKNCIFVLELWLGNSAVLLSIRQPKTALHCQQCHQTILEFDCNLTLGYMHLPTPRQALGGLTWETFGLTWRSFSLTWETFGLTWKLFGLTWKTFGLTWKTFGMTWKLFGLPWKTSGFTWMTSGLSWTTFEVSWATCAFNYQLWLQLVDV